MSSLPRRRVLLTACTAVVGAGFVTAVPARAAWTPPAPGSNTAVVNNVLTPGTALRSPDGRFALTQQTDGNLVLRAPEGPLWSSRTVGGRNETFVQSDGNVVIRSPAGAALWTTGTAGAGSGVRLTVQSDGNLVLTAGSRTAWQTRTARRAAPPLGYTGSATQVVSVVAGASTATTATVSGWSKTPSGWVNSIGGVTGFVGAAGVGAASEGSTRTPAGTFTLTRSFGRIANPGTRLSWFTTDTLDWWDENPASPTYNLHVRRSTSPGGASENLYRAGAVYDAAVVIDHNTARTPGAGSGFFLHVTNGRPTAGCVAVPRATVVAILRWLDPAAHPVIRIGMG
ncbi:L,D-transpeptidase family protein [Jatrophihabitans sp. YIM 134969]